MDANELRERAAEEVAELGPIPTEPREREMWAMERRVAHGRGAPCRVEVDEPPRV